MQAVNLTRHLNSVSYPATAYRYVNSVSRVSSDVTCLKTYKRFLALNFVHCLSDIQFLFLKINLTTSEAVSREERIEIHKMYVLSWTSEKIWIRQWFFFFLKKRTTLLCKFDGGDQSFFSYKEGWVTI